jgi:hypothetical protein
MKNKPEFRKHPYLWATKWLGYGISITEGDLFICNGQHGNRIELKKHTPFLNKAQLEEFKSGFRHVVVYDNNAVSTLLERNFESPYYQFYCPYKEFKAEYKENRYSWLLIQEPTRIEKSEARKVFRAEAPFPCCGRFSVNK